ncbi:unnamed protein product [Calicophoron daubneyi]|uniref:Elongator complex protein 5 n=1 Tax=Calicophoron daubneyi TaxID=300641 RepID=A0AAV2TV33_CALDB
MTATIHKIHTGDLLTDKISSRFVCLLDKCAPGSLEAFWRCILVEHSHRRPCIVVTSGLYSYDYLINCSSLTLVNTDDFDSATELLDHISALASSKSAENRGQGIYIFVEFLSWLFLDCPSVCEFKFWSQRILNRLFHLSTQAYVQRLLLAFRPLSDLKESGPVAGTSELLKLLERCAISHICCGTPTYKDHLGDPVGMVVQPLELWHRRALQWEFVQSKENFSLSNKPAFTEHVLAHIDPATWTFMKFLPCSDQSREKETPEVRLPENSFAMNLSESEKMARDAVPLPYTPAANASNNFSISYQPDCFDDLDDEDPDDDLDM